MNAILTEINYDRSQKLLFHPKYHADSDTIRIFYYRFLSRRIINIIKSASFTLMFHILHPLSWTAVLEYILKKNLKFALNVVQVCRGTFGNVER